ACTGARGGQVGQSRAWTLGLDSITPERNTEIEGGFDATFGNQFATLGVTLYQKNVTDLLLLQSVAPSTGYRQRIFNGGKLRNRGIEAALAVSPVRTADVKIGRASCRDRGATCVAAGLTAKERVPR